MDETSEAPAPAADARVTIGEFCAEMSMTDRRVELLAAFAADETRASRLSDGHGAYAARYAEFRNRPVE